ncbi:hypothetical protein [Asanoa siamensis]|uniref:Uncharacterized protein n=1 Tax=Asanoa siamensis TaxID=926357 RepID=A0ABQ4CM07_9ACTN|nr:hypothetical protein [Asanoa siamensis]GIF72321.1 hypothetical protein Asi02nite_18390 [Asanoa siamensis]
MNLDEGMELAQAMVEAQYPGRWQEVAMGDHRALAIVGSATVSLLAPKLGAQQDPFLSLTCGLATEFWLDEKCYERVNALNQEAVFGSYQVIPGDRDRASVLAKLLIPLEPIDWINHAATQWAARMINTVVLSAERASPALVSQLGARHFHPGAATTLWMMS